MNAARPWIAILRDAVEAWRKANGWSRESVAQMIVEAHDRIDGPLVTGIKFDPPTQDTFERMRVNADRLFRWLDDVTKDRNLLPPNFIRSVLVALPLELRLRTLGELLVDTDLAAHPLHHAPTEAAEVSSLFRAMLKEGAEAQAAMVDLLDGADHAELLNAQRQIVEGIAACQNGLAWVESRLLTIGGDRDGK